MLIYSVHGDNDLNYADWLVLTRGIGRDPNDRNGENFRRFPHTKIVRLNHGYGSAGTIPLPQYYADFAQRVANYVEMSPGCSRWIIGNEPNHRQERPEGQPITPKMYAECYTLCREAIRALEFHTGDQVLLAAVAPWNVDTKYAGNPSGDWIRYFEDVQAELGAGGCDGFAPHTYTREQTPAGITSDARMGRPFEHYHNGFRTYMDWMAAILHRFQGLPVYLTEFCVAGEPWKDINTGCVQAAYAEIDGWNRLYPDRPISCLTMYRWQYDQWELWNKPQVQADFNAAVEHGYSVPATEPPHPPGGDMELLNPGLEPPFNEQGADNILVARHWTFWYNQPDHPSGKRPELSAEIQGQGASRVLEGQTAQKIFWTHSFGQAWIGQVVAEATPGTWYELKAHAYIWSSSEDNPNESVNSGKVWVRLAAHPWGVLNPNDWGTEFGGAHVDQYDHWVELSMVFQAKSTQVAAFLWCAPEHPTKHNDIYWDKVSLTEWECDGGTEPPIEPPGPGECLMDWERMARLIETTTRRVVQEELEARDPVIWPKAP